MKNRAKLDDALIKYARENRHFPHEIYATKQFIKKLKDECNATIIFMKLGVSEKLLIADDVELIYQGVKIKEIKDFIITK